MSVLAALGEVEDQVFNVEGPTPHSTAMVLSQLLLVLGRAEEGNITCLIELGSFLCSPLLEPPEKNHFKRSQS